MHNVSRICKSIIDISNLLTTKKAPISHTSAAVCGFPSTSPMPRTCAALPFFLHSPTGLSRSVSPLPETGASSQAASGVNSPLHSPPASVVPATRSVLSAAASGRRKTPSTPHSTTRRTTRTRRALSIRSSCLRTLRPQRPAASGGYHKSANIGPWKSCAD